jgi:ribonuclease HI
VTVWNEVRTYSCLKRNQNSNPEWLFCFFEIYPAICFDSWLSFFRNVKKVTIHTDGACHGNPGPGGWAAVLQFGQHTRELSGGSPATTNNRMELQAAIEALAALKEPCEVDFFTDSEYLRQGVSGWIWNWKRNGWRTKDKKPVKNDDLWRALDTAVSCHKITWHWVKGHAGNAGNELCDKLATCAIEQVKKAHTKEQLKTLLKEFKSAESKSNTPDLLSHGLRSLIK